jgi:hypothetical protein
MGFCFHRGPVLGNQGNFYDEFERYVKEGSGNGILFP